MTLQEQAEALYNALDNLFGLLATRGGPDSGHHGHRGRPGEVGGSLPSETAGRIITPTVGGKRTGIEFKDEDIDEIIDILLIRSGEFELHEFLRREVAIWLCHGGQLVDATGETHADVARRALMDIGFAHKMSANPYTAEGQSFDLFLEMGFARIIKRDRGGGRGEINIQTNDHPNLTSYQKSMLADIFEMLPDYDIILSRGLWGQEVSQREAVARLGIVRFVERGGPDSGHHGHRGRPGKVGGSLPSGATQMPGVQGTRRMYEHDDIETSRYYLQSNRDRINALQQRSGETKNVEYYDRYGFVRWALDLMLDSKRLNLPSPEMDRLFVSKDIGGHIVAAAFTRLTEPYKDGWPVLIIDVIGSVKPGHGTAIMTEIAKFAATKGAAIGVESANRKADKFYERFGMTDISDTHHYGWRPDEIRDWLSSIEIEKSAQEIDEPITYAIPSKEIMEIILGEEDDETLPSGWRNMRSIIERGGPGSGHHGHQGRIGEVGGSEPGQGPPRISVAVTPSGDIKTEHPIDETKTGLWLRGKNYLIEYGAKKDLDAGWYFSSFKLIKDRDPLFAIDKQGDVKVGLTGYQQHLDLLPYGEESIRGFATWVGTEPVLVYYRTGFENLDMLFRRWSDLLEDMGFGADESLSIMVSDDAGWSMRFPTSEDAGLFPDPEKYRSFMERGGPEAAYFNVLLDDDFPEKQAAILAQLDGLEPVPSDRLHITLLYIEQCERSILESMVAGLSEPLEFNVEATGLEIFGENSDWLVLTINPTPGLIRLYHEVLTLATINGLTISDFSEPDQYKPHISIARGDLSNVILPKIAPFKIGVVGVQASVNDFEVVNIAPLKERDYPAPHCGRQGEVGGSRPREECAPGQAGKRIVKIIGVRDTREYAEDDEGRWKPIGGTGDPHECERCGKWHEVHAHVELEDGGIIIVGTTCAKAEFSEMFRKQMDKRERAAKRLKSLEAEFAAKRTAWLKWHEEYKKVEELPRPTITFSETTSFQGYTVHVAHMGDAWVNYYGEFNEERKKALIESWRGKRMYEKGYSQYVPHYDVKYYEKELAKVRERAGQDDIVERGGPGSGHFGHVGRPEEVGGSQPAGAAAPMALTSSETERIQRAIAFTKINDKWDTWWMEALVNKPIEYREGLNHVYISYNRPVGSWMELSVENTFYDRVIWTKEPLPMKDIADYELAPIDKESIGSLMKDLYEDLHGQIGTYVFYKIDKNTGEYRGGVVHPTISARHAEKNPWRLTVWDFDGFSGHDLYPTAEDALGTAARSYGFVKPLRPETFDRVASTERFMKGVEANLKRWREMESRSNADLDTYVLTQIHSLIQRGGSGSGHFGHVGRPGEVGGSLPRGAKTGIRLESPATAEDKTLFKKEQGKLIEYAQQNWDKAQHLPRLAWMTPDGTMYSIINTGYRHDENAALALVDAGIWDQEAADAVFEVGGLYAGREAQQEIIEYDFVRIATTQTEFNFYFVSPNRLTPDQRESLAIEALLANNRGLRVIGEPAQYGLPDYYEFDDLFDFLAIQRAIIERGGPGSGHHEHLGRPGKVGGSLPKGAAGIQIPADRSPIRLPADMELSEGWRFLRKELTGFRLMTYDEETGERIILRDIYDALDKVDQELRDLDHEEFYVYSLRGQDIYKVGTETQVVMDTREMALMDMLDHMYEYPDPVISIHNHPPSYGRQSFPPSFSDLRLMVRHGHTELHVVVPDGRWVVSAKGREIPKSLIYTMETFWNDFADRHLYAFFPTHTKERVGTWAWNDMIRTNIDAAQKYSEFAGARMFAMADKFSDDLEVEWKPLTKNE